MLPYRLRADPVYATLRQVCFVGGACSGGSGLGFAGLCLVGFRVILAGSEHQCAGGEKYKSTFHGCAVIFVQNKGLSGIDVATTMQ